MEPENEEEQLREQIGDYRIIKKLGQGTFGYVVLGQNINPSQDEKHQQQEVCAIKIESLGAVKTLLHMEYKLLGELFKNNRPTQGFAFPQVKSYGQVDYISFMAMECLDITLQDYCNKVLKNDLKKDQIIRIFYNVIRTIQQLHKLKQLHRDIKPSNFMLKKKPQQSQNTVKSVFQLYEPRLYAIDLGLSKSYMSRVAFEHIPMKQNKKIVGTPTFCSINTHKGLEQSRRDDIEASVYMTAYLVKKLPWEKVSKELNALNEEIKQCRFPPLPESKLMRDVQKVYDTIKQIKEATDFSEFLKDEKLPSCLIDIYKHALKLEFKQQPDYELIYQMLEKEHQCLTGNSNFCSLNCLCEWQSQLKQPLSTSGNDKAKQEKKVKINFKIPESKLKKPLDLKSSDKQSDIRKSD